MRYKDVDEWCGQSASFSVSPLGNYCAHLTADSSFSNEANEWEPCFMAKLSPSCHCSCEPAQCYTICEGF